MGYDQIQKDYWALSELEQGFGGQQANIRLMASTWMLTSFAGIGFILQRSEESVAGWLISSIPILICIISTMAFTGLFVLWVIDQLIFQRLLNSVTLMCLKMEFDNPSLPRTRALFMASAENVGMSYWFRLFYLLPMTGLVLTNVFVSIRPGAAWNISFSDIIIASVISVQFILMIFILNKSKDIPPSQRARYFDDKNFYSLFREDGSLDTKWIIARYKRNS